MAEHDLRDGLILPPPATEQPQWDVQHRQRGAGWRGFAIRALALLCACSLSIGSHYGSYFLGPLKSRLAREIGTSNAQFSLLISAFSLNSTWTPLVGGLLASYFGTAISSIVATSFILLGQLILLLGDLTGDVRAMALGMFVFGLGISPLAVVQESIICQFFASHGLGVSLALGLVAGKGASFVSARTSFPLSERFGPHAPFVVSTLLAAASFTVNLIYVFSSSWLARGAGVDLDGAGTAHQLRPRNGARMTEAEARKKVAEKRRVRLKDVTRLGDTFWAYILVNALCGAIWSPFMHLAANLLEQRYDLSEHEAADQASLLLAGSIFLYPICGYLTDRLRNGPIVHMLFVLSSLLTLICYTWLTLPPEWTKTPAPAMVSFSAGHGFSTLLLVIIVPHIVPLRYVSTALGAHKSIEQAGSTISQTLAGVALDSGAHPKVKALMSWFMKEGESGKTSSPLAIQLLLGIYLFINILQLGGTFVIWALDSRQKRRAAALIQQAADAAVDDGDAGVKPSTLVDEEEREVNSDGASEDSLLISPAQSRYSRAARGSWSNRTRPLLSPTSTTSPVHSRHGSSRYVLAPALADGPPGGVIGASSRAERQRGKMWAVLSGLIILSAWVLFMGVAVVKLRKSA